MSSGKPIFRFRFIHDIEGTFEITEPLGWPQTKLILDRDPEYSSLVERFDGAFTFFGSNGNVDGGTAFIRSIGFFRPLSIKFMGLSVAVNGR